MSALADDTGVVVALFDHLLLSSGRFATLRATIAEENLIDQLGLVGPLVRRAPGHAADLR